MLNKFISSAVGAAVAAQLYIEDVFSAYTYTGTGAAQSIVNGIDLSTNDGMVWIKSRSAATDHQLFDAVRGATNSLGTNLTSTEVPLTNSLTSFNANGFSLGSGSGASVNTNAATYTSWTFRNAANFFDQAQISHTNGAATNISLADLAVLGMVVAKRTDSTGDWITWHRSLTASNNLRLNTTAVETTTDAWLSVSGTTATLSASAPTGTYIVYAWAHDDSADGLIQCGSYTNNGSGNATINLGWEPQFALLKFSSTTGDWFLLDTMRGWLGGSDSIKYLLANTSGAEASAGVLRVTPTGFTVTGGTPSATTIYMAIRRGPMKLPTAGTQVYNAVSRTGTGAAATVTGVGFPPDLVVTERRSLAGHDNPWEDRLRGATNTLMSSGTYAEVVGNTGVVRFDMDGFGLGTATTDYNTNTETYVNWCFRRYPGVFDIVCYTGTGAAHTEAHNLGVAPELWLVKVRSQSGAWAWGCTSVGANKFTKMPSDGSGWETDTTIWNNTLPTASVFSVGTAARVNNSTHTFVAHLWATLAGVSKVGSYTGTGTTLQVNCGFSAGARFVLIIRTDGVAQSFLVWDTVRGIIAGNDPYLDLSTPAAEDTSTDYIDTYSAGFEISSTAPAAINASGGTYIFLAIA